MAAFEYVAIDNKGHQQKGIIESDSARQARQELRDRGLTPLQVNPTHKSKTSGFGSRRNFINTNELAVITRQLAALLVTGIPVEESLLAVAEQMEKPRIKTIIMGVRGRVLEGYTLANSMEDYPKAFPILYRASIAAGEKSGNLDKVLEHLADYVEQQQHLRQKLSQAMIYPSMMILISLGIVSFLLVYVVPKMVAVFNQSGQKLPTITSGLINFSNGLKHNGIYILIGIIVLLIVYFQLLKRDKFRFGVHRLMLKIPLMGSFIKLLNTSRFSRTFAILSIAGVEVLEAMRTAAGVVANHPIQQALINASYRVREGVSIHRTLKDTTYFPVMSIYLIASGENTGQLENMLERAANNQDRDLNRYIETGLTMFEPMLILVMGAIVLFIVLAILLPIFSLDQIAGGS